MSLHNAISIYTEKDNSSSKHVLVQKNAVVEFSHPNNLITITSGTDIYQGKLINNIYIFKTDIYDNYLIVHPLNQNILIGEYKEFSIKYQQTYSGLWKVQLMD